MLVLDSLDALFDVTGCSVSEAYLFVNTLLQALPNYSRLVAMSAVDAGKEAQALAASLTSPQLWSELETEESSPEAPGTHATIRARVHSPGLIRHLYSMYGLTPPSSSVALCRTAYAEAGKTAPEVGEHKADPRFWSILHSVGGRGPLGVPGEESGWWNHSRVACLHALDAVAAPHGPELSLEQALGLQSDTSELYTTGVGFLELRAALSSGKHAEELAACAHDVQPDGRIRLRLLALDMDPGAQEAQAPAAPADPHASMVQQLPFNLGETQQQRERREQVSLPYTYQLHETPTPESAWRGSTGKSAIFFEPESEDDEDDDDPDDDLDV